MQKYQVFRPAQKEKTQYFSPKHKWYSWGRVSWYRHECHPSAGIKAESAYYESLHEAPLIANTIARKKLYEMNRIISDTAEYGCYLFNNSCIPLLTQFMNKIDTSLIGKPYTKNNQVKNQKLIAVNKAIRNHPIEIIAAKLRASMTAMK